MIGQAFQELNDRGIARIDEEGMIPNGNQVFIGQRFDLGEVHDHPVGRIAGLQDDVAGEGYLDRIAMAVQMTALAPVVGDSVTGVKLEATGDLHGSPCKAVVRNYIIAGFRSLAAVFGQRVAWREWEMLNVSDHSRDSAGLKYIYPVVSRRAGGVSLGINLNVNNACNWRCVYCQVPDLTRGGPPPVDLGLLESELRELLADIVSGDFLARNASPEARRLVDLAFSGNGEPTSSADFLAAVESVGRVMSAFALPESVPLRLITNGSLLHRPAVRKAVARIGSQPGEIWFKLDAATESGIAAINGIRMSIDKVRESILACAELAPTWIQTCYFALDGKESSRADQAAYLELVATVGKETKGVLLYGLARPSMQPEAGRLSNVARDQFHQFADRIAALGVRVVANP